jgi:hypothetical protein
MKVANLPDNEQILYLGILNDNPSLQADVQLQQGYFNVSDNAGTGAGWNNTSGNATIRWKDILTNTTLGGVGTWFEAYTLGQFQTIGVNLTAYTPAIGNKWTVQITKIDGENNEPFTRVFTYICASAVLATEVTAFALEITNQSNGTITAVNNAQTLEITGNFGDINLEVYGTQVIPSGQISAAPITIVAALVQPSGTPAIVANYIQSNLITAAQYNTYGFKFYNHVGADEHVKQNEMTPMWGIVFVNNAADAGAGSFNQEWIDILSGVYNPQTAYN